MNLCNDFARHCQWCLAAAIDVGSCGQAYEIVTSLAVVWHGGYGVDCAQLHGTVMLLVCLYILTKFHLAMSIEV